LAGKRLLENVMGIRRIIASRQRTEARYRLLAICGLLFATCCLLSSCGRKGAPALKSYEKPDAPSGLEAIHREADIILLWNFPDDKEQSIKGFYLMKSTGGDFKKIASIKNDTLSVTDTNFETGKIYKYKVLSESLKGVLSKDSNIVEVRPQKAPPPPGGFSFTIEYNTLTLTWKTAGGGILYNVYKSHKPGVYPLTPLNREPLKEPLFTDNFDIDKIVFYTVRSLLGGTIRDEGAASEEVRVDPFEFVPPSPEGLQAVATGENVYLLWKEPAETWIKGYRIYREINKKEGFILIGESQTPSFVDKEKPLTDRNYRVTALGPSKEGPPAEIENVIFSK
jgi:hypothetical protein